MTKFKMQVIRFFGWLFVTEAYAETLTDEQIGVRAFGRKGYAKHLKRMEQLDEAMARILGGERPELVH